jgi:hypothetical protein
MIVHKLHKEFLCRGKEPSRRLEDGEAGKHSVMVHGLVETSHLSARALARPRQKSVHLPALLIPQTHRETHTQTLRPSPNHFTNPPQTMDITVPRDRVRSCEDSPPIPLAFETPSLAYRPHRHGEAEEKKPCRTPSHDAHLSAPAGIIETSQGTIVICV